METVLFYASSSCPPQLIRMVCIQKLAQRRLSVCLRSMICGTLWFYAVDHWRVTPDIRPVRSAFWRHPGLSSWLCGRVLTAENLFPRKQLASILSVRPSLSDSFEVPAVYPGHRIGHWNLPPITASARKVESANEANRRGYAVHVVGPLGTGKILWTQRSTSQLFQAEVGWL